MKQLEQLQGSSSLFGIKCKVGILIVGTAPHVSTFCLHDITACDNIFQGVPFIFAYWQRLEVAKVLEEYIYTQVTASTLHPTFQHLILLMG